MSEPPRPPMPFDPGDDLVPVPAEHPAHVAVVAGHGDVAAGLVSAVAQITGRGELLLPITNRGLCPSDIEAALRTAVSAEPVRAIFTDLPAGSCTIAARRLLRERPDLLLVTGVNLPTLVDFVCRVTGTGSDAPAEAMVAAATERGRGALNVIAAPTAPPAVAASPSDAPCPPPATPAAPSTPPHAA